MKKHETRDLKTLPPIPDNEDTSKSQLIPLILKTSAITFGILVFLALITASTLIFVAYQRISDFAHRIESSPRDLMTLVKSAYSTNPEVENGVKYILILGLDTLENRPSSPTLTDTILLVSINTNTGEISMLSLPRDLWSNAYKTKINALYEYGKERYPQTPEKFTTEVLREMLGVPIHHTVPVSLATLEKLLTIVGGVEVTVPAGFTDSSFPRTDIDVTSTNDPSILYETVTFSPGLQKMDGKRALQYIRSRKSDSEDQGTDLARSTRQQLVIQALVEQLMRPEVLLDPKIMSELYILYKENYEQYLPMKEVLQTIFLLMRNDAMISLKAHQLSVYPEDENGALEHPNPVNYQNQWVYIIRDELQFKTIIQNKLGYN